MLSWRHESHHTLHVTLVLSLFYEASVTNILISMINMYKTMDSGNKWVPFIKNESDKMKE